MAAMSNSVSDDELHQLPERISHHFDRMRDLLAEGVGEHHDGIPETHDDLHDETNYWSLGDRAETILPRTVKPAACVSSHRRR